jgi:hypothetical protein
MLEVKEPDTRDLNVGIHWVQTPIEGESRRSLLTVFDLNDTMAATFVSRW